MTQQGDYVTVSISRELLNEAISGLQAYSNEATACTQSKLAQALAAPPSPDMRGEVEALAFMSEALEFAYKHGLHEVGYDPIASIRAQLAEKEAEVERLVEAGKPFVAAALDLRHDDWDTMKPASIQAGDLRKFAAAYASTTGDEG